MITHRIVSQEPTPLEQLVPDISPDLVAIVTQALKKSSAHRFRDTESMRLAIARLRRRFESDDDWTVPTSPVGSDNLPTPSGSRGTGSARRRTRDSVGVAELTPPPDPRRTDREALARRRTAQVEAALALAKTLFEQRDFDSALDACQQALTLDESHSAALELENEIQTAIRIREGVEVAADDAAALAAEGPTMLDAGPHRSRMLESQAVTRYTEDAFAVTGLPPSSVEKKLTKPPAPVAPPQPRGTSRLRDEIPPEEKTAERIPAASAERTIIAPPRRTPSPSAGTTLPAPVAASAPAVPAAKTPSAPAKPAKVPVKKAERADVFAPALRAVSSAVQAIGPALSGVAQVLRRSVPHPAKPHAPAKQNVVVWAGAGVLVLAVGAAVVFMLTRGPVPTGTTIIDAVPWATVTAVRNESGEPQELATSPASTPLAFTLPVGTYQITLTGPPPESKAETITVRIEAGGTSVVPVTRFQRISVEDYFEQYIGAGDAPGAPRAAPPESAAAPVPAPATATGSVQ